MAQFIRVGTAAEFDALAGGKLVEVNGHRIAVFKQDGTYYAIQNECPHRSGSLAEGIVEGDEVICPLHGARFNLKNGAVMAPPARQGVRIFPVRITGSELEIEID